MRKTQRRFFPTPAAINGTGGRNDSDGMDELSGIRSLAGRKVKIYNQGISKLEERQEKTGGKIWRLTI